MNRLGILLLLLMGACGFAPNEAKLVGAWQAELRAPQKLIYAFQSNHTYSMRIAGQAGVLQGTWKLEGGMLTMTMGSFAALGMTNTLPNLSGVGSQTTIITKLTDSTMAWRSGLLGGELKFKRVRVAGQS